MTPEARLDRLERIAKLFVKAGLRARRNMRDMDEKLNLLVSRQIQTDEKFARTQERFARNEAQYEERVARNEERLAMLSQQTEQKFAKLAESQALTDRKLAELIDIIREGRNGNSFTRNN